MHNQNKYLITYALPVLIYIDIIHIHNLHLLLLLSPFYSPVCTYSFSDWCGALCWLPGGNNLDLSIIWQTSHWEYHANEKEVMLLSVFRLQAELNVATVELFIPVQVIQKGSRLDKVEGEHRGGPG